MKLRVRAFGLAVGIVFGLGVFLATVISIWNGQGHTLSRLVVIFPGYDVTYGGAFVGLLWGVVSGFVGGALVAWLYGLFQKALYKPEATV